MVQNWTIIIKYYGGILMDKLPKVFANKIDKEINNTQDLFYSSNRGIRNDGESIVKKINNIFASPNHVYKSRVKLTTNEGVKEVTVVGKTQSDLITLNDGLIRIAKIIDIERI